MAVHRRRRRPHPPPIQIRPDLRRARRAAAPPLPPMPDTQIFPPISRQHLADRRRRPASYQVEGEEPRYAEPHAGGHDEDPYHPNNAQLGPEQATLRGCPPSSRRMGIMVIAGVFALAAIGTAGLRLSRALPPLRSQSATACDQSGSAPSKIVPASNKDAPSKQITDRVNTPSQSEKLMSREEKPVEIAWPARYFRRARTHPALLPRARQHRLRRQTSPPSPSVPMRPRSPIQRRRCASPATPLPAATGNDQCAGQAGPLRQHAAAATGAGARCHLPTGRRTRTCAAARNGNRLRSSQPTVAQHQRRVPSNAPLSLSPNAPAPRAWRQPGPATPAVRTAGGADAPHTRRTAARGTGGGYAVQISSAA